MLPAPLDQCDGLLVLPAGVTDDAEEVSGAGVIGLVAEDGLVKRCGLVELALLVEFQGLVEAVGHGRRHAAGKGSEGILERTVVEEFRARPCPVASSERVRGEAGGG